MPCVENERAGGTYKMCNDNATSAQRDQETECWKSDGRSVMGRCVLRVESSQIWTSTISEAKIAQSGEVAPSRLLPRLHRLNSEDIQCSVSSHRTQV